MDYDTLQAKLVYDSENAHFRGLRSTSITGPYNEDLLLVILRKEIPKLSFAKGNIVSGSDIEDDGSVKKEGRKKGTRRPQVDIIAYVPHMENFKSEDNTYCVVDGKNVVCALEIKKWFKRKDVNEYCSENAIKYEAWEKRYGSIPYLYVCYRIWSYDMKIFEQYRSNRVFAFSHSYEKLEGRGSNNKHIIRILDEKTKNEIEKKEKAIEIIRDDILYSGELERLVKTIKAMV